MSFLNNRKDWKASFSLFRPLLLVFTSLLAFAAIVSPFSIRTSSFALEVGDVATQDIVAPRNLSFVSDILTLQAQQDAESSISKVYLPADPGITRRQIESMKAAFRYITIVRSDQFATLDQKIDDLSSLANIQIDEKLATNLLNLSDSDWENLQQESLAVLEQVMRSTLQENDLVEARRNVPTLISFSIPQEQTEIVEELVTPFIIENSLFSEEQTNALIQKAKDEVEPVARQYIAGETIVQKGQIITPLIREALSHYGLIQSQNLTENYIAAAVLVLISAFVVGIYLNQTLPALYEDKKGLLLTSLSFLVFLFSARFIISERAVAPYVFPIAALGMTIASLYSSGTGMVFSLVLSILVAFDHVHGLDLTIFYGITSFIGILTLGRGMRIANFFWAGIASSLAGAAVIIAYRITDPSTDLLGITTLVSSAFIYGLISASITLILQYIFSIILGKATALQLLEISRPDHPLLQFILQNAPGTYQHSLMVSNLAEQAARIIGADALLVRVGALHHDAGKALNPSFFIENQVRGKLNPHDDLDPKESSETIVRHVTDGVKLAQKYRLPNRIQDFILEHHGTLVTRYQLTQALNSAGDHPETVNLEDFRYPGPKPGTRETAILMLADGVEARARAEIPKDDQEIRALVKDNFEFILQSGQLENTNITLQDLNQIAESFVSTLKNTYHPRIKYPKLSGKNEDSQITQPARSIEEHAGEPSTTRN